MTTILALDATSEACSAALLTNGQIKEIYSDTPREHTRLLLPMVDQLLADHQLTLNDLDAIAFGRGPGSFTGLRICLGVVQGLAFGSDLPVIPVSSLQAMALHAMDTYELVNGDTVYSALDARMNEVYWGAFAIRNQLPVALDDEMVLAPESLASRLGNHIPARTFAVGAGWHYPVLAGLPVLARNEMLGPRAEHITRLAEVLWKEGGAVSVMEAEPVYLRNSVAWKKREKIRNRSE